MQPEYPSICYDETIAQHAARLGISYNQARTYRRVLTGLLGGRPPQNRGSSIPWHLQKLSADDADWLMTTLFVRRTEGKVARDDRLVIRLAPTPFDPHKMTERLRKLRWFNDLRTLSGRQIGGAGLARRALIPPYGYERRGEKWIPSEPAASVIVDAFHLMLNPAFQSRGRPRWKPIAGALNEQGYTRKDGRAWKGDDVRTLPRCPTYAGFVWRQQTQELEHLEYIEPIIEPPLLLEAAKLARGTRKDMDWVDSLAERLAEAERER